MNWLEVIGVLALIVCGVGLFFGLAPLLMGFDEWLYGRKERRDKRKRLRDKLAQAEREGRIERWNP